MPKTQLGRWSVGLIAAMPILFVVGMSLANSLYAGVEAGNLIEDLTARPLLSMSMLSGIVCGMAAFVTGAMAVFKHKERSWLVYLSTGIGLLLLVFIFGDLFSSE